MIPQPEAFAGQSLVLILFLLVGTAYQFVLQRLIEEFRIGLQK